MTVDLIVPDIGAFHDVPVIEVLVKAGDRISKDAPLVTLESEKAAMEVPASEAGLVKDVVVKVGDKVSAGTVIAKVESDAEQPKAQAAATAPSTEKPAPATAAATNGAPADTAAGRPQPAQAAVAREPERAEEPAPAQAAASAGPVVHASPAIRRFARELGVDLAGVSATGPNGRVTREDVQGFVKRALGAPSKDGGKAGAILGLAPWPTIDFAQFGPIERAPLSRIKRISGPNLHRNWVMIPHVTQHDDADVTDLEAFREQLNAEQKTVKVTLLAFLMKAVVAVLKRYPAFNSSLDGDELVIKHYYHIGFAADTPDGLVVPVLRDVDSKGVLAIAQETAELAARAREGQLSLREMQGGTFTISSLGGIGGTYFSPIVNAPEVAILGVCRAALKPVWDGAAFVPRLMLPLSLSYDHRVVDGAAAARFTVELSKVLADMRRTLL